MHPQPHTVGAHLVFERDGQLLLGKRALTARFAPGLWHLPAGKVEQESPRSCAVREAHEELGVTVQAADLALVHVVHLRDPDQSLRMQLFFRATAWDTAPYNKEPDKCAELRWFARWALPHSLVAYTAAALEGIAAGWTYTELGWS
ncbi:MULTISPECIES: NUDIX hydrolase [Streptomyces]|uniref:NUDIX hydrolase n=1 Tax=Streptomyces TaxID=1883 RepID=UPI0004CD6A25|nr:MULTISPECIES: NUDIX domain-containing protein [Streptomyces]KOT48399.1 hypothetical protein ADK43_38085 [Streptomyces rimosus subsp. rimosus]